MIDDSPEIWKPYFLDAKPTQYEASSKGRIRNVKTGLVLTGVPLQYSGYLRVLIYREGKRVDKKVHRVVWEAFNGPIPKGLTVDHIDGDKSNNSIKNLQLLTPSENTKKYLSEHPEHGFQKTIDDQYIRKYFQLLKEGVYYKRAWAMALPFKRATDYSKKLLYGSRRRDLWLEYQPFPLSSYFDIVIDSDRDLNILIGCIMNGTDTEQMLRYIHKSYYPETISLVYFLRSQYDKALQNKEYNSAAFKKDLDTLLQLGYRTTDVIFILHVDDDKTIRDVIEQRKKVLGINVNKYRDISDSDAKKIMELVESGLSNNEIYDKLGLERSYRMSMFMSSYRHHLKQKLLNSEKTSSTIESIASQDVKK